MRLRPATATLHRWRWPVGLALSLLLYSWRRANLALQVKHSSPSGRPWVGVTIQGQRSCSGRRRAIMNQISTITFFRFDSLAARSWAFAKIAGRQRGLKGITGQSFYKLMGSGRGRGFHPLPDWSVYSLVQVWDDEIDAEHFLAESSLMQRYRSQADEVCTLFLKALRARGAWSGRNPFVSHTAPDPDNPLRAVITRATIKVSCLKKFWSYVPLSEQRLASSPGLIFAKGVGEAPFLNMATFSLWENEESLRAYAYQDEGHRGAITRTRDYGWYSEELFSRFQPYRAIGRWQGVTFPAILGT